eukprot:460083-Amphidinium_carterae.1
MAGAGELVLVARLMNALFCFRSLEPHGCRKTAQSGPTSFKLVHSHSVSNVVTHMLAVMHIECST